MIGDIRLKEEQTGVAGDVYILDAAIATPVHFAKFTPALVKKFLVCVQEAYPVKLKEVHVINVSPLVDTILNFVKPLLKEKIRNRIFMHSDLKTLYDHIPREILPTEYGGDAGPIKDIQGTPFYCLIHLKLYRILIVMVFFSLNNSAFNGKLFCFFFSKIKQFSNL